MLPFYAISGFMGLAEDWLDFAPAIQHICPYSVVHPDKQTGLWEWARAFNKSFEGNGPAILIGYSLGGRLAMHALLENPQQWAGGIFISGHFGLIEERSRFERLEKDYLWARRFEEEPWETLILSWNQQDIFRYDPILDRHESDYSRKALADTLRYWSLGRQEFLLERLQKLSMPLLWIVGEKDDRQRGLIERIPFAKRSIAPEIGHRVLWGDKNFLMREFQLFRESILCQQ